MTTKSKTNQILIILIPFLLALIIMVPRLLSPQFGLMDDSASLSQAQRFLNRDFSMSHDLQAGRFRPVYWLYYTLIYALAGYHPFWFFFGNLILLFILLIEIRLLVKNAGGAEWQATLASCSFLLSMPIIENFYTLSKGEPLQLVLILSAILLVIAKSNEKPKFAWGRTLLASICILMAVMVKETAIVILPLATLWTLYSIIARRNERKTSQNKYWGLVIASVIAVIAYFGLREIGGATALLGGTYTDRYLVDASETLQKLLRWITQFAFYFSYMVPFILLWIWFALMKIPVDKKLKDNLFLWGTWWVAWFAIFIPWEYAETYYLLPFAFGGALLIGLSAPIFLRALKKTKPHCHIVTLILSVMMALLFLITLPNFRTDAKMQLAFDKANSELLTFISEQPSQNATVLMNLQTSNEYFEKVGMYISDHIHRNDLDYRVLDNSAMETINDQSNAVILMPFIENQPKLTVRAGVEEVYQNIWNEVFLTATEGQHEKLASFEESFMLSNINLPVILCKFGLNSGFCQDPDPLIDTREFMYGWDIYLLQ